MNWYIEVIKKYAVFSGRARRKEYWMFFLFNLIIAFVLGFIEGLAGGSGIIGSLYKFAVLIPGIAVGVRRMHDTDRSGWWLLLPIVNLVFLVQDSQQGDNQYGPNPKVTTPVKGEQAKKCPRCAETIRYEAAVCRFCGHHFSDRERSVSLSLNSE